MTTPKETRWKIDPHTIAKHEILRRYLGAWFPIMAQYNRKLLYVDGFCGPGRYEMGELGSPLIALEQALSHENRLSGKTVTFLFIDEREDRLTSLQSEISGFRKLPADFNVQVMQGYFDRQFGDLLEDIERAGMQLVPTFCFIDPFGFSGFSLDLIGRLLENSKTEVFVNFSNDAINRFLEHPNPKVREHIVSVFGTQDVLTIPQRQGNRHRALREMFQEQLRKHADFVRYFQMEDEDRRPIYSLFFAGNHPLGHVKMKEAFWKVDPTSGLSFSDATDPDQLVLFDASDSWLPVLASQLVHDFSGSRVDVDHVKKHVEDKTPFLEKHMKAALQNLESRRLLAVDELKGDGTRRRKGTFPSGTTVTFA